MPLSPLWLKNILPLCLIFSWERWSCLQTQVGWWLHKDCSTKGCGNHQSSQTLECPLCSKLCSWSYPGLGAGYPKGAASVLFYNWLKLYPFWDLFESSTWISIVVNLLCMWCLCRVPLSPWGFTPRVPTMFQRVLSTPSLSRVRVGSGTLFKVLCFPPGGSRFYVNW